MLGWLKAAVRVVSVPFHCHGRLVEQLTKLLSIRLLVRHEFDHFCSDEFRDVFVFCTECVVNLSDSSCMLSVELVVSLATQLVCKLLEGMSDTNDVVKSHCVSEGHCSGWNEWR